MLTAHAGTCRNSEGVLQNCLDMPCRLPAEVETPGISLSSQGSWKVGHAHTEQGIPVYLYACASTNHLLHVW